MSSTIPQIATPDELCAIAERAVAVLESMPSPFERDFGSAEDQRWNVAFEVAKDALRFCAHAAVLHPDARLLPLLARGFDELVQWQDDRRTAREIITYGISSILEAGAPISDVVTELAEHDSPEIRRAVASALSPRDPRAVALLQQLAQDPIANVRAPARDALGDVAWWLGKFDADPIARLSEEEAERHKATIEALSAMLDRPRSELLRREDELVDLAAPLPDALAVEAARIVLAAGGEAYGDFTQLGAMMIAREGGVDAFLRVCEAWAARPHFHVRDWHVAMIADAPREARLAACLALARWATAQPASERAELRGAPAIAAEIAAKAFPLDADASAILDLVTAPDDDDGSDDRAVHGLNQLWRRDGLDVAPFVDRILAARLAGFPGRWKDLHGMEARLDTLPREALRRAAAEAIGKDDVDTVRWGLSKLLFEAHDPDRDPDRMELVRGFWDDPRLRLALLSSDHVAKAAVSLLRPALRRGELGFPDALVAARAIGSLWPARKERRRPYAPFLGPRRLHGPMTEDEWAALRRARKDHVGWEWQSWVDALIALPGGPWHPDDWAFIESAVGACEEGEQDMAYLVALALRRKPSREVLPLFERLITPGHDQAAGMRRLLRETREELGIATEAEGDSAGSNIVAEWMDEDD